MLRCRNVACAGIIAVALAACSGNGPLGRDVVAQARPDGRISFDVVDLNDQVLAVLLAHQPPRFDTRFKQFHPPPDLKIAVGDTVSVVIWEAAPNGLFGNSLTEVSLPAGAAAELRTGQAPAPTAGSPVPAGLAAPPAAIGGLYGIAEPGGALSQSGGATLPLGPAGAGLADLAPGAAGVGSASDNPLAIAALGAVAAASQGQAGGAQGAASSAGAGGAPSATARSEFYTGSAGTVAGPQIQKLLALATLSGRPGTAIPGQQVGDDGGISIPYAGRIHVAGKTPQDVARAVEKRLGPMALDPQAVVLVQASAANSVAISGDAVAGKRVPLSPGGERLLQVIAAAGGSTAPVRDTEVALSRGGVSADVPLATLIADPAEDIYAEPGDVLTLQRRPRTFSVFGATGRNTAITFTRDRLSLAEALAEAGGLLDQQADPRSVFVFRYEPDALVHALGEPVATAARDGLSPVVYRLDMKKAQAYLLARRFPVHDKDVIFAADAPTQQLYYFFQALQNLTGPAVSYFSVCESVKC